MLAVVVGIVTACTHDVDRSTPAPTAPNPDAISIGMIVSTSGAAASIGLEAQRGAIVAQQEINALGGVLGKQISLEVIDDQSDPTQTLAATNALVAKGTTLIIGPTTSSGAVAVRDLILNRQVLFISPSATSPLLDNLATAANDAGAATAPAAGQAVLYRTAATDAFQSAALIQYATFTTNAVRRCPSTVLVYQNDDYGNPIASSFRETYTTRFGLPIKADLVLQPFTENKDKYDSAASQMAAANAPCQIVIAQPQVAGEYMRAVKRLTDADTANQDRWNSFITIGSDGLRQNAFLADSKNDPSDPNSVSAGEGSFSVAADTAPDDPSNAAFRNLFNARYPGVDPGRYGSTAYDAVMVMALSIASAQSFTDLKKISDAIPAVCSGGRAIGPERLSEALLLVNQGGDLDYEGASGSLTIAKENGSVRTDFDVWQIKNGAFQLVSTISSSVLSAGI